MPNLANYAPFKPFFYGPTTNYKDSKNALKLDERFFF